MGTTSPAAVGTFSLELPSDATMLSSARLFAAAVAREAGCAEDLLDDVKLAVSEACTEAIRRSGVGDDDRISLRAEVGNGAVTFEVTGPVGQAPAPEDDLDHFSLIAALFEDARRHGSDGSSSISFSTPLA
jgi:hypothetical protein